MPYIEQHERADIEFGVTPRSAGELNYAITRVIVKWLSLTPTNYGDLNTAIGVLECAKLELYRRIAAPYEDTKIRENGDVY